MPQDSSPGAGWTSRGPRISSDYTVLNTKQITVPQPTAVRDDYMREYAERTLAWTHRLRGRRAGDIYYLHLTDCDEEGCWNADPMATPKVVRGNNAFESTHTNHRRSPTGRVPRLPKAAGWSLHSLTAYGTTWRRRCRP